MNLQTGVCAYDYINYGMRSLTCKIPNYYYIMGWDNLECMKCWEYCGGWKKGNNMERRDHFRIEIDVGKLRVF